MGTSYIYGLFDPRSGELRYVGKTEGKLSIRVAHHVHRALHQKTNEYKACWVRKLAKEGLRPEIDVLEEFPSPTGLSEAECFWISYYKSIGCRLTNLTAGGEGTSGYRFTPEQRRRQSESVRAREITPGRVAAWRALRVLTPEQEQEVVLRYKRGASLQKSAEGFEITDGGVRKILIRHGVDRRKPWEGTGHHGPTSKLSGDLADKAIRAYQEGFTSQQVGTRFGVSARTILTLLKKKSIQSRPTGTRGFA